MKRSTPKTAEFIKRFREKHGITQCGLTEKMKFSRKHAKNGYYGQPVSNVERGSQPVGASFIKRFFEAFPHMTKEGFIEVMASDYKDNLRDYINQ